MSEPEHNPFETPIPRGTRLIQATLRVVVAVQCWGMAAARLHRGKATPVTEFLAPAYELSAEQIPMVEDLAGYFMVLAGIVILIRPNTLILVPVIIWQAMVAICAMMLGHGTIPELEPAEQAVRYVAPIALLLIDFWPPRIKPNLTLCRSAIGLLRLATVCTFASHGAVCLFQFQNGGSFVELLTLSLHKVTQYDIDPYRAKQCIALIGAVDIAVAVSLLTSRNRAIVLWMVLWGFLTAFSRILAYGTEGYDMALIRAANGGAPLAVLIFWMYAVKEHKPSFVPEKDHRVEAES